MRRRARNVPFARRRFGSPIRELTTLPVADWPKHLQLARTILVDELAVSDAVAVVVLRPCLSAAQACADAINWRARDAFDGQNRARLRRIFGRAAKCAKRLPASRRHMLDRKVCSALGQDDIDSETIEGFIEALIMDFGEWPRSEPSLTILRAVTPGSSPATVVTASPVRLRRRFTDAAILLREDYSSLPAVDQREVELALTALSSRAGDNFDTTNVCMAVSRALGHNRKNETSVAAHDVITEYVTDVADVWRQHGLRPTRARNPYDASYRSRFHRFVDLVLTSVVDPWSRRHDGDQHEMLAKLRKAHAELPEDVRRIVGAAPRRGDVEWLVSEDHVRNAWARIQKSDPSTP